MKIIICSSVDFTLKIKECYEYLKAQGHDVEIPYYAQKIINGEISLDDYMKVKNERGDTEFRQQANQNLIKRHYEHIRSADAILVLNIDKKGIKGYIGGNTFLEIGFAHVLNKKIYLYNELPEMPYSDELKEMSVNFIEQDLSKIPDVIDIVDEVRTIHDARVKPYKELMKQDGRKFVEGLISITNKGVEEYLTSLNEHMIENQVVAQHPEFIAKKELAVELYHYLFDKTKGRVPINNSESMIIGSKIHLVSNILGRVGDRNRYSKEDIYLLLNCYRSLFEINFRLVLPHLKIILNTLDHIDWSDVHKLITDVDKKYDLIFKSMNGELRNSIAHESYYIEENKFLWIKDDGSRNDYPIIKIIRKIIDLYLLMAALYYGLSVVQTEIQIKVYNNTPVSVLKQSLSKINFDSM